MTETSRVSVGAWRELLGPTHLGASTVLAGGVLLYATNEFLTISLMPSAVADIGGQRFYAWVNTVYLVASVIAATTVHPLLMRLGPRPAYWSGLSVFAAGTLGCAPAPTMELLLVGRTVQGAAGGLLAGLGYSVINTALPSGLWTRASAFASATWGVGTLVGPAAGGLFAQFGSWRWAFGVLVGLTVAMGLLVPFALPGRVDSADVDRPRLRIPLWSLLLLLGAAALVVSTAGRAAGDRDRYRDRVAAPVRVGDESCRRPGRRPSGRRGDQHVQLHLWGLRGGVGGRRGEPRRRRERGSGALLRVFAGLGAVGVIAWTRSCRARAAAFRPGGVGSARRGAPGR